MYSFSTKSLGKLNSCHIDLINIMNETIKFIDFSVISGFRNEKAQNTVFNSNFSQLKWPDSLHNTLPSNAIDIAPYPIDWHDINRFYYLAGMVMLITEQLLDKAITHHTISWGGNWKNFKDYGHFELGEYIS